MRKICYSVAMSLDGYVAGPNGEADWIVKDPEIDFMALFVRFDTLIMGRRTFDAALAVGRGGSMPGIQAVVVSTTLRQPDYPEVTIVGDNLEGWLKDLRAKPGKDIWLFGGGSLFRSFLDLGQVDTVEVAIIPVLLGGGVPFLPERADRSRLRLMNNRVYNATGIVGLEYAVENPSRG
jgi:dihydrofolate reductase